MNAAHFLLALRGVCFRVGLAPLGTLGPWVSRMVLDEDSILGGTEWAVRRARGALLLPTPWIQASSQHLIWVCKQMWGV